MSGVSIAVAADSFSLERISRTAEDSWATDVIVTAGMRTVRCG